MAKKKNRTRRTKKSKGRPLLSGLRPMRILTAFAVVCLLGGIVLGVIYWDKLIKRRTTTSATDAPLEIKAIPAWINEQLKEKLLQAANADGLGLKIDETVADRVRRNIQAVFPWLDDAVVRTTHSRLQIEGRWRLPLVLVKRGLDKFYLDRDLVVLDFVELPHLNIVKLQGVAVTEKTPELGQPWQQEDIAAAVELVELLAACDREKTPEKPLLSEIAALDVANCNGRKNKKFPHIVLYTTDNTEVIWGAEIGKWQRHLEATDAEKLAKLYAYYKEYGTLLGDVKYINLRDPQDKIPLPIDDY